MLGRAVGNLWGGARGRATTGQPALARRLTETEPRFEHAVEGLDVAKLARWQELLAELKRLNQTMTCEDSLLPATAQEQEHFLAPLNTRHFAAVRSLGLQAVNSAARSAPPSSARRSRNLTIERARS